MKDKNQTAGKPSDSQKAKNNPFRAAYARFKLLPITWRIVGLAVAGVLILGAFARFLPYMKERTKFFTDAAFAWLVFVVVVVQSYIYSKQTEIMGDSLMVSNSSQIDIDHIEMVDREGETVSLKIANIGHVPADHIRIWVAVFIQIPEDCPQPLNGAQLKRQQGYFWDFKSSKLFPGKLRIKLWVPIYKHFTNELVLALGGHGRFIVQIRICNEDGFGSHESQFAFRFVPTFGNDPAGWLTYTVRDQQDLLRDLYEGEEEQPTYYDPK